MNLNFVRAIQFTHDGGLARAAVVPISFNVGRRNLLHGAVHDLIRLREQHRRAVRIGNPERLAPGGSFPR